MESVKKGAGYAAYTPKGRGSGWAGSNSDLYFGWAGGEQYSAYLRFRLTDFPRIRALELHLYRKDEFSGCSVYLSEKAAGAHTAATFEGDHRLTVYCPSGTGWKTLPVTGALFDALTTHTGAFILYLNGNGYLNASGGTGGSRSAYLTVTYEPNGKSAFAPDKYEYETGETACVAIAPVVESNTHDITYETDAGSGVFARGVRTDASFTIPSAWLTTLLHDRASADCAITVETFDADGAPVGSETQRVTVVPPAEAAPSVTEMTVSEGSAAVAAVTDEFLSGRSWLRLSGAFSLAEGMTAVSGTWRAGDAEGTFTPGDGSFSVLTPPVSASGSVTVSVSVTDSRGMTGGASETVTVEPYAVPALSWPVLERCGADGRREPGGGTYALAEAQITAQETGTNRARAKIEVFDGDWQEAYAADGTSASLALSAVFGGALAVSRAYPVRITVYDDLTPPESGSTAERTLPKGVIALHVRPDGKGIGVGGMAETDGLHILMPLDLGANVIGLTSGGTGVTSLAALKMLLGLLPPSVTEKTHSRSAPSGTAVTGAAFTAPSAGIWLVTYKAAFGTSGTGRRIMHLLDPDGTAIAASELSCAAAPGSPTQMQGVYFTELAKGDTLTVNLAQNSGSSLTVSTVIRAVRLAG